MPASRQQLSNFSIDKVPDKMSTCDGHVRAAALTPNFGARERPLIEMQAVAIRPKPQALPNADSNSCYY